MKNSQSNFAYDKKSIKGACQCHIVVFFIMFKALTQRLNGLNYKWNFKEKLRMYKSVHLVASNI